MTTATWVILALLNVPIFYGYWRAIFGTWDNFNKRTPEYSWWSLLNLAVWFIPCLVVLSVEAYLLETYLL